MTPRAYRHKTRVVTSPSVGLSLSVLGLVVAFLAAGKPVLANVVVMAYIVLGGRVAGRVPTWHLYAFAALMLAACGTVRILTGSGIGVAFLGTAGLCVITAGVAAWPRLGTTPSGGSSGTSTTPTGKDG